MKILILGSEGVIGTSLSKHLNKCGHTVTHWDIKISIEYDLINTANNNRLRDAINASDFIFFLAYDVGGSQIYYGRGYRLYK